MRLRVAAEVWWVESQWVIVELVKRRLGWAFVPWHVAANSPAGTQLVSFLQGCTGGHLLGEHLHASSTPQFIGLSSGVLVSGGTAGVPD